jgi:hypothetical protein
VTTERRIGTRVFVPVARPYTKQELAEMSPDQASIIKLDKRQKVVREDHIATIDTDNRQELKSKVLDLIIRCQPNPILIKLNTTLDRTFLVDTIYDHDGNEPIVEDVYFTYNGKGKEIQEFIESKLAVSREQIDKALAEIGWRLDDYAHAITGGKTYHDDVTDQEIENNLKLLHPHERSTIKQIMDIHRNTFQKLYAEIAEKFGINKKFRKEERLYRDFEPYATVARSIELRQRPLDINTVLLDFVEERGRIITRNSPRSVIDNMQWVKEFHPEMAARDVSVADNGAPDCDFVESYEAG